MTTYYFDSSALVKRYFTEVGSERVSELTTSDAGNSIIIADITLAEVAAAISAKHRASDGITLVERDIILGGFLRHCAHEYTLIPVNRVLIDNAVLLTKSNRLRGYDAVQLATGLAVRRQYQLADLTPPAFVCADDDLLTAAMAQGFIVENPNDYA